MRLPVPALSLAVLPARPGEHARVAPHRSGSGSGPYTQVRPGGRIRVLVAIAWADCGIDPGKTAARPRAAVLPSGSTRSPPGRLRRLERHRLQHQLADAPGRWHATFQRYVP